MGARADEARIVERCVEVARGADSAAADQLEANVFRVAAAIMSRQYSEEADRLRSASRKYFVDRTHERLSAEEVIRNEWIANLPRLQALLSAALKQ